MWTKHTILNVFNNLKKNTDHVQLCLVFNCGHFYGKITFFQAPKLQKSSVHPEWTNLYETRIKFYNQNMIEEFDKQHCLTFHITIVNLNSGKY